MPNEQTTIEQPIVQPKTGAELRDTALAAIEAAKAETPPAVPPKAPEPPKPPAVPDEQQRLANAYAKAERDLRAARAALTEHEKVKKEHDALVARLKDPRERYRAIEEFGGSYADWTDTLVGKGEKPKDEAAVRVDAAERRMAQLEERIQAKEAAEQQRTQQSQQEAARAYARDLVTKSEDYAFTRITSGSDDIVAEFQRRMSEGEDTDEHVIAKSVEAQREAIVKKQIADLSKVPRFVAILAELGYVQSKAKAKEKNGGAKPAETLTNEMSEDAAGEVDFKTMTPDQIRSRAIRKAKAAKDGAAL